MEVFSFIIGIIAIIILFSFLFATLNISKNTKLLASEQIKTNKLLRMILKEQNESKYKISVDRTYIRVEGDELKF